MIHLLLAVTMICLPRFLPLRTSFVYFLYTPTTIGGRPINQTSQGVGLASAHVRPALVNQSECVLVYSNVANVRFSNLATL